MPRAFDVGSGDTIHLESVGLIERRRRETAPSIAALLQCSGLDHRKTTRCFFRSTSCRSFDGDDRQISLVNSGSPGRREKSKVQFRDLSKALPGVDVRPIRQIVYSEGRVLGVIRWILLSVTALILVIIVICLMATMTAIVLERRKDIGVMKALGASDHQVMRLFLAEGAGLGWWEAAPGFFLGSFWALAWRTTFSELLST